MSHPGEYHVADLNVRGELRASEPYTYDQIQQIPGAIELIADFSTKLYSSAEEFELALTRGEQPVTARWRASSDQPGKACRD